MKGANTANKDLSMPKIKPEISAAAIKKVMIATTVGSAFNKTLIEAALNTSNTKTSHAFSKSKRFGDVIANEQGYTVSVLGIEKERIR